MNLCVVSEYFLCAGTGQGPCKQICSWSSYISQPHFHCCEASHISMASACLRSWSDRGSLCGWLSEFIQAPQRNLNNQLAFSSGMEAGGWLDVCVSMFISCWSAVLSHYLMGFVIRMASYDLTIWLHVRLPTAHPIFYLVRLSFLLKTFQNGSKYH